MADMSRPQHVYEGPPCKALSGRSWVYTPCLSLIFFGIKPSSANTSSTCVVALSLGCVGLLVIRTTLGATLAVADVLHHLRCQTFRALASYEAIYNVVPQSIRRCPLPPFLRR